MEIALFGATGMIGTRILNEALTRGHRVRAIVRNPASVPARPGVTAVEGDAREAASVATTASGCDLAISAYGPGTGPHEDLIKNAHALLEGLAQARVPRVIVVGGAGSWKSPRASRFSTPKFSRDVSPAGYRSEGDGRHLQSVGRGHNVGRLVAHGVETPDDRTCESTLAAAATPARPGRPVSHVNNSNILVWLRAGPGEEAPGSLIE